jgi:thiol-disulfide isomerase/thioredoxin
MHGVWLVTFLTQSALLLVVTLVVVGTLRRISPLLERAEAVVRGAGGRIAPSGLSPGARVPAFIARYPNGQLVSASDFAEQPVVYLFMQEGCGPCRALAGQLASHPTPLEVPLLIVTDEEADTKKSEIPRWAHVLLEHEGAVSKAFQSNAYPQAFAVNAAGLVAGTLIPGDVKDLRELAKSSLERGDHPEDTSGLYVEANAEGR